jgi:predicted ABC-type ATPase
MPRSEAPWFVLVAGINGAGKSTFSQDPDVLAKLVALSNAPSIEVINPDDVTKEVMAQEPGIERTTANIEAAKRCEKLVADRIHARRGHFLIETVLSTDKYCGVVADALQSGWQVLFIYISLDSADEAIERVQARVADGGHDVPKAKIRKRWKKSRRQMPWFWARATRALLFRNPSNFASPEKLADKRVDGWLEIAPSPHQPASLELLEAVFTASVTEAADAMFRKH